MNELALFAGAGGGILGGHLLGWKTVCAVEIEKYPRKVLLQRQRDGILPRFPIWDDITTFDGKPWQGRVDIVSGGFPCQDISAAGKGAGIEGERSGLWTEMARVIDEVRPRFAFVENSPMLTSRGLGAVLGDLAELGYDARWCVLGADDAGAPHRRKRIWILAYAMQCCGRAKQREQQEVRPDRSDGSCKTWTAEVDDTGCEHGSQRNATGLATSEEKRTASAVHNQSSNQGQADMADSDGQRLQRPDVRKAEHGATERLPAECGKIAWWDIDPAEIRNSSEQGFSQWSEITVGGSDQNKELERSTCNREERPIKSELGRVANGVAHRVDRLKAIGNGQVPAVAALAFTILSEGLI